MYKNNADLIRRMLAKQVVRKLKQHQIRSLARNAQAEWWQERDSNPRSREAPSLQPGAFVRSAILPVLRILTTITYAAPPKLTR